MFEIEVTNNRASTKRGELLTKGQIGAQVQFAFNDHWTGMKKTAVFKRCGKTIDVIDNEWNGDIVTVPSEMTEEAGLLVHVGVYGVSEDGKRITPTLYAPLGAVALGAEPDGDPSTDPTLPVWAQIQEQIGDMSALETEAKNNLVAAINEAAKSGGGGKDGTGIESITYKGEDESGGNVYTVLLTDGTSYDITAPKGADGITPHIGDNGNWYLGTTDTGKPSRGETGLQGPAGPVGPQGPQGEKGDAGATGPRGIQGETGPQGPTGADGKSAYQYAVEGGYTGTEEEFAEKLASGALIVHVTDNNGTLSADKTFIEIRDAIVAGIPVMVDYDGTDLPLIAMMAHTLFFGAIQCANDDYGAMVGTNIIEITSNGEVNDISAQIDIPKTLPNPNALTFTGAVTGSYDGSEPVTVNIPSGGSGVADISLGVTGATVGQIAKITAVDDTGKPTAWSPVDMPSVGGDETNFQLVFNQECVLDADVNKYEVNIGFGLQDFKEFISLVEYSASTNDVYQDEITFDGVIIESFGGPTLKDKVLRRVIYAKRVTQTEYMGIHRASSNSFDWQSGNMPSTLSYFSDRIKTPTGKLEFWRNKSTEAATITIKLYKR